MKLTRKSPGIRGITPNIFQPAKPPAKAAGNVANHPAVYSPQNAVPQMKAAGFAQPPLRSPPPVYRPQNGRLEKVAHNGLAGRGNFSQVSHSFDAAPGGLRAPQMKAA